jgi:hypothetical protein
MSTSRTKYFYPPRPGNGAGTFSDNIVGLQTVNGGGLTLGVFDFNDIVTEKVNRTFNVGAFSEPLSLDDLGLEDVLQSRAIQATQFRVYPNYDVSQVLNFSLYGSLAKRFSVSVTKIINYFPAAIEVLFDNIDFTTGATAINITYDSISDETFFQVNLDRLNNPFAIEYSVSATTNIEAREIITSKYRNLTETYLDYAISINDIEYKVVGFEPSPSTTTGPLGFYVSGQPFPTTATTYFGNFLVRPNDYIVDKVFLEDFDEVEKFLINRLTVPEYTAFFQIPAQNQAGQFYTNYQQVTWPKDGPWNLSILGAAFDTYLTQLQSIAVDLDSYKTNLISRFLVTDAIKEFDTLNQKVEKILQIYGRSFDQVKQFIESLAFMNSVQYNPGNNIPNQLLVNLSQTLGWSSNFSPITNENFLDSVFGNQSKPNYPGYARALTPTELNYAFYRNLILNAAYLFKSKGTRRSIEFLMRLIGAPESLIEYNEHIYLADQRINLKNFTTQYLAITGGTYVEQTPTYLPGVTFKVKGVLFSAFTSSATYEAAIITRDDYPVDDLGYPKAPRDTENYFFQLGAGWYEVTPQHRSPDQVTITGNVYTGQNIDIQTQLQPFTYGQLYLDRYRDFPYMNLGFKLRKIIDNNKSWLDDDDKLRISNQADYNAYYYVGNEKLVLNVKNIDLFLNPAQGLVYDVWDQSRRYDYPIPESGLTVGYPVPGGVDWTYVNPQPKQKTFFEFYQTFWENMVNTRNRLYITDGKTGGYPTLQSIWWKYIQSEQTVGLPNNKYTYQKLIDYVEGIGPYWMKLVEQMIPATTIWQGGIKFENSVLHKQKFVYRRQRGCIEEPVEANPCKISSGIFNYTSNCVNPSFSIYPWLNGDVQVSNFSSILYFSVNSMLSSSGVSLTQCILDSVTTTWYIDLRIGNNILIQQPFFYGVGSNDIPTATDWRNALIQYLPQLYNYGYTFYINGNNISFVNLTSSPYYVNEELVLNTGINININCNV